MREKIKLYEPAILTFQDSQGKNNCYSFVYDYYYSPNLEKIKNEEKPCLSFVYDKQQKEASIAVNPAFTYYTGVSLKEVYDVILNKVGEEVNKHPYSLVEPQAPFIFPERDDINLRDLNIVYFNLISNTLKDFVNEKTKENNIALEKYDFPQTLSFIINEEPLQFKISQDGNISKNNFPDITPVDFFEKKSLIKENLEVVLTKNSKNIQNYTLENKLFNLDVDTEEYRDLCEKEVKALKKELFSGENSPHALVFYNKDTEQIHICFSQDLFDKTQNLIDPDDYFDCCWLPSYKYQEKIEEINNKIIDIDKNPEKYIKEQLEIKQSKKEKKMLRNFLIDYEENIDFKAKEMTCIIIPKEDKVYLENICNNFSKHISNIKLFEELAEESFPDVKNTDSLLIYQKESNQLFISLNNNFKHQNNISLKDILPSLSERTNLELALSDDLNVNNYCCVEGKMVNGNFEKLTPNDYQKVNLEFQAIILEINKEKNKELEKSI